MARTVTRAVAGWIIVMACIVPQTVAQITVTVSASGGLTSPATLQAGDNITLECSTNLGSSFMIEYSWSTSLDGLDGSPVQPTNTQSITGYFLHGANNGMHTCTATAPSFGNVMGMSSFTISNIQGVTVWYRNPQPGGLLPNNYVILAVDMVFEIRCLSGDASSTGTSVISPSTTGTALSFSQVENGFLRKNGETSITGVATGVYTCRYDNGGVVSELSFGVYSMDRVINMVINPLTYTHNGSTLTIECNSNNWPASSVTWQRGSYTITPTTTSSTGTYTFSQTLTNRDTSAYRNVLIVSNTTLSGLLGEYTCSVSAIRHNYATISSASSSVSVSSLGSLTINISAADFAITGSGFAITCSVEGMASSITIRRDGGVVSTGTGSTITASTDRFAVDGNLGPGDYTCEAVVNGESGVAWKRVQMKLAEPVFHFTVSNLMTPPYYAGTTLAMMCDIIPQVPLEQTGSVDILRNGSPVSEAVKTSSPTGVQSMLTLSPLSMTANSGAYVCVGRSSPNPPNNNILNSNDVTSTITLQVSAPTPNVSLSSTTVRLPSVSPYNNLTLTCTATLPVPRDTLNASLSFTWLKGSDDVTSSSSSSDPLTSTLTRQETMPSTLTYTCRYSVVVSGDTPYTADTSATVTVTGSQSPNPVTSITEFSVSHVSILLQFIVTSLAFTPETYRMQYGLQSDNLDMTSPLTAKLNDFDATNHQLIIGAAGLVPNTTYYYQIQATNTVGTTSSAVMSVTTLPAPPSAAPVNVTGAVVNSTSAFFTFESPSDDDLNGVLVGFTITCKPSFSGLSTITTTISITTGGSLTVTELQPGTPYTCGVAANNSHGSGPTEDVFILTPEEVPSGPPLQFMATPGSTNVTFSLSEPAPEHRNGNITSYTITCQQSGTNHAPIQKIVDMAGSVTVEGFRPYVDYTCSATASNSRGPGPAATENFMTDSTAPSGPPRMFTANTQSHDMVKFSWAPVLDEEQNGMILNYTITCDPFINPISVPDNMDMSTYTITRHGFTPATRYTCTIVAISLDGNSPPATTTVTTMDGVPSSPLNVTAVSRDYSVLVTWLPPAEPNGMLTHYTINVDPRNGTQPLEYRVESNLGTYTITGLIPYQIVAITLSASTSAGAGPTADTVLQRPLPAAPGSVEDITTSPNSDSSTLLVTIPVQPAHVARGVIENYTITVERYSSGDRQSFTIEASQNDSSTKLVGNLSPEVPYNVTVAAINMIGTGDSVTVIAFSREGRPPRPEMVMVDRVNDTHMIVSWQPIPLVRAKGFISIYEISYQPISMRARQSGTVVVPGNQSNATIGNLVRNQEYRVTVSASTRVGSGDPSDEVAVPLPPGYNTGLSLSIIVVIVVAVVVLIILLVGVVILVVVLCICKQGKYPSSVTLPEMSDSYLRDATVFSDSASKEVELEDLSAEDPKQNPYQVAAADRMKTVPVSLFSQHVQDLHQSRDKGFEMEYQSLNKDPVASHDAAKMECNRSKNRFANIFPYDFSRVTLEPIKGIEGSDYINASYIDGYTSQNAYIAAQGPLPGTITDFWRMIWEKKLDTVVVLTKCIEAGKRKCEQYWPENINDFLEYPSCHLSVTVAEVRPYADYDMRKLVVKDLTGNQPPLTVTHWHFLGWPDHGVPTFATSLISFIRQVRKSYQRGGPPMLVHCSAGVGRTGAFIMLDYMLEKLVVEHTINVYESLSNMRAKRVFMVQTMGQYVFIHDALDELISCGETDIHVNNLKVKLAHMHKIIPSRGITGFHEQYQLLEKVSRKPNNLDLTDGEQSYNKHKNRYLDRLPYNLHRLRLRPSVQQGSEYINASLIDGYKARNAYIATQGPLQDTVNDFWRMIWEWKSRTIVMLCETEENGVESSCQYWPQKVGEPLASGKLVVTMQSEELKRGYFIRKFALKEDRPQSGVSIVTQFQCTCWPEHSCPTTTATVLEVLEEVNKNQRSTCNKPITVMCNDGMGRTGTFICLHAQQERVKTEGVLDVFQFIKSSRIQRQRIVADLEQYIFLHQALSDFLDKFNIYSNFKM